MSVQNPNLALFTPLRLWLFAAGMVVFFGLLWLKQGYVASTPAIATARALQSEVGADAGEIQIAGRYVVEGMEGFRNSLELVCGSVGPERTGFATLVRRHGRGFTNGTYTVETLVLDPAPNRVPLAQEAELLGTCARLKG